MSTARQTRLARIERGIENFGSRCRNSAPGTSAKTTACAQFESLKEQKKELAREIEAERAQVEKEKDQNSSGPDNQYAQQAAQREKAMMAVDESKDADGKPTISTDQAMTQSTEESKAKELQPQSAKSGTDPSAFSTKSTASAISANTPGSLNTGTGGQKTDVAYVADEGHRDPLFNIYEAVNKLRDKSISFVPRANEELSAVVLAIDMVTNADPGVRTTAAGDNKAVGTNSGTDKTPQRWYKCYCIVDFYTACLPLPKEAPLPPAHPAGNIYPGPHSTVRASRFPYFLGREDRVAAPQIGQTVKVKYLDDDNFSYGVYLGPSTDSQETITADENKNKASTQPAADPKPIIAEQKEEPSQPPTAAAKTTSAPAAETSSATESSPAPVTSAAASKDLQEEHEREHGPWSPYKTKEIGLNKYRYDHDELKGRLKGIRDRCNQADTDRKKQRWCGKLDKLLKEIKQLEDKIKRIEAHV